MPPLEILRVTLVPLIISGLVIAFVITLLMAVNDGIWRLRRLHQVPCYRCKFYTDSPYLKCPVRPLEAGSEAALDCKDYEAANILTRTNAQDAQLKQPGTMASVKLSPSYCFPPQGLKP